jgi:hypothetical protein
MTYDAREHRTWRDRIVRPHQRRAGLVRALRVIAGLGGLALGAAICIAITARARAGELLQDAGAAMLSYAPVDVLDAPRVLHVNGLALRLMSGHTRHDVTSVLDLFDRRCGARDGGFARRIAALRRGARAPLAAVDDRLLRPVLRGEGPSEGYLACLDLGADELAPTQVVARLRAFAATLDLARLGDLRFVWARADEDGTSYVAVWSEGPVRLAHMFPARGDAPGLDPSALPRPPRSRRVLSAWQEHEQPTVTSYSVELPVAELRTAYRDALIDAGFSVREGADARGWLIAARASSSTAVLLRADRAERSIATLLPLR